MPQTKNAPLVNNTPARARSAVTGAGWRADAGVESPMIDTSLARNWPSHGWANRDRFPASMSHPRLLCGLRGLALGLLLVPFGTIGCATAPAPSPVATSPVSEAPPKTPAPPPAATPAAGATKSAVPWEAPAEPTPSPKIVGDARPNLEMNEVSEKAW